jgi:hypothetical protein
MTNLISVFFIVYIGYSIFSSLVFVHMFVHSISYFDNLFLYTLQNRSCRQFLHP